MAERIDYDVLVGLFLLNEQYDEATAVLADITDDSTRARLESRVLNAKRRRLSTQPPPPVQKQEKAGAAVTTTTTEETAAVASAAAPGAIPQPLEVKLVGGDPKGLPDQLPATLSNADLEKNPDLLPYNSPFNDAYSRKMTFKNVKGQEAVQQLFERTLVAPSVVPGLFDSSSGGIGALLYGVAGTGKCFAEA